MAVVGTVCHYPSSSLGELCFFVRNQSRWLTQDEAQFLPQGYKFLSRAASSDIPVRSSHKSLIRSAVAKSPPPDGLERV